MSTATVEEAADAVGEAADAASAEQPLQSKHKPVIWTGKEKEATVSTVDADAKGLTRQPRLKPNTTFLNNCIRQAVTGNQREMCATATKAACQVQDGSNLQIDPAAAACTAVCSALRPIHALSAAK